MIILSCPLARSIPSHTLMSESVLQSDERYPLNCCAYGCSGPFVTCWDWYAAVWELLLGWLVRTQVNRCQLQQMKTTIWPEETRDFAEAPDYDHFKGSSYYWAQITRSGITISQHSYLKQSNDIKAIQGSQTTSKSQEETIRCLCPPEGSTPKKKKKLDYILIIYLFPKNWCQAGDF